MNNKNYCLITGASEGLGRAFAIEFAQRKINLVLVALPGKELINLACFLRRNFEIDVITIPSDLTIETDREEVFNKISASQIEIQYLINNAGVGGTMPFMDGTFSFFQKQINLNVMATTHITKLFLPMLEKKAPAYILNVSSLSCFFFLAKKQVYGATKSFIYFFSKSLKLEESKKGVYISVLCPGPMNTNGSAIMTNRELNWLSRQAVMEPEDVANFAVEGLLKKKTVLIPGKLNRIFLALDSIIPESIKNRLTAWQMNKLKSVDPQKHMQVSPAIAS